MNTETPSRQMLSVLQVLEGESSLTARQLNNRLYQPNSSQSRRAFAASMSRTVRRMERRQLLSSEGGTVAITEHGMFTLHPERLDALLQEISIAARESAQKAVAELLTMPEYQWLKPTGSGVHAQHDGAAQ